MSTLLLHRGQREVLSSTCRNRVVVAGRRWGKTQTAKTAILKRARLPRQLIWYVAPTYKMARSIMWRELLAAIPPKWIVHKHDTRMEITLINGSQIELKGADKPDTLRGVGLHLVVIDEAQDIKHDTWLKVLRPTLVTTRGEALIIGTPKAYNWLYTVYMYGQRGEIYVDEKTKKRRRNSWQSWQFPTASSPFVPREEIDQAREDLDEKSFNQEFNARFETMSGRVYYAFDRTRHLGDYAFNPALPIWIGQDFNIDPMSSIVMQPQPNGEVWVVAEVIRFGSNTQEIAEELDRLYYRHMKQVVLYPDPAGQQREHVRGESDLEILRQAGFKRMQYRRKHPKVTNRINAVNRMLVNANGIVRLRINRSCSHLIRALEETIYKPGSRDVDKSQGLEHAADALGYCIEFEFPVRGFKVLGLSI